jgi:hypothetical protein
VDRLNKLNGLLVDKLIGQIGMDSILLRIMGHPDEIKATKISLDRRINTD